MVAQYSLFFPFFSQKIPEKHTAQGVCLYAPYVRRADESERMAAHTRVVRGHVDRTLDGDRGTRGCWHPRPPGMERIFREAAADAADRRGIPLGAIAKLLKMGADDASAANDIG